MLPASYRLVSSADFAAVIGSGVRVGRPTLVVHARRSDASQTRVGFVVSRQVGGAVVRNRVKRRLRALARPLVMADARQNPQKYSVVVRALPPAATQPDRVANDFAEAWGLATMGAKST